MADYWKSQARKYCDFCKCWISDNKPSVQFHENGKRHKANVATRLKQIGKKSIADQKAKQRMDDDIRKMEEAAMKAYAKDAEQNLDYSAKVAKGINDNQPLPTTYVPPSDSQHKWHEAKSDTGDIYYWNTSTGESQWEKPSEGYVPLDKSQKKAGKPPKSKKPSKHGKRKHGDGKFDKNKKKSKDKSEEEEIIVPVFEPIITGPAYGRWEKVESTSSSAPPKPIEFLEEKPELEFKEKTLPETSQSSESTSTCSFSFKKSKFKGNVRQRSNLL